MINALSCMVYDCIKNARAKFWLRPRLGALPPRSWKARYRYRPAQSRVIYRKICGRFKIESFR